MTSLYILTTTLLLAHQIDSAFWQEWDLFGIPGGIQVFVLLNVMLTLPFLAGLAMVARGLRAGTWFAGVLSILGVATFFIHVGFALRGHREFGLPMSWAILGATLMSALALGWRVLSTRRA
jgi:hypothetical protein